MRTFELHRDEDVTGVSGTGIVAEGAVFDDGAVALRWIVGEHRSTGAWASIEAVIAVHGHDGRTRLVWTDQPAAASTWPTLDATSRCRSCHAPIAWRRTPAGSRIPLDPTPRDDGNVAIVDMGAVTLTATEAACADPSVARYASHFATCPDANTWRSKGGDRG